ncbi:MAG: ABC transporter substrate-binding protein [Verrucomicrobia bacterium]|nr:ABC transporter substrate-binding protein [Verrucomicrobiota bacterium]
MTTKNTSSIEEQTKPVPKRWHRSFRPVYLMLAVATLILGLLVYVVYRSRTAPLPPIQIAVATSLSQLAQWRGRATLDAVRLCFAEVNQQGGIQGHPLEAIPYDDEGNPEVAVEDAKKIGQSPALAVIGHERSLTSLAAGPIYKAASIPAITATASAPGITADNPYYFRTSFDNSSQGHILAAYAINVLGQKRARVIYSNEVYGKSLEAAFVDEFIEEGGNIENRWCWDTHGTKAEHAALIQQTSADIAEGESGVLFLAISPYNAAEDALTQLRRTGVNPIVLGGTSLGNDFPQLFKSEPEEIREPGFFTDNTFIASPIILDSASERALEFSDRLYKAYGAHADEVSSKYYETSLLLVEALRKAGIHLTAQSRDDDRRQIRNWLAAQNSQTQAFDGLSGPLYFDAGQTVPQAARVGRCVEGRFVSAPIQLAAIPNPSLIDLDAELASGHVIRIRQTFYWLQQVVYTGIDINQISRVDTSKGTFGADFYLWFRYAGSDAVREVDLNAATEKSPYDPKAPLLEQRINGLHYSLYRVRGDFRTTYDFHDYPFDSQSLFIRLTNPRLTREQVIYAIDDFGLKLPRSDARVSELPALANWDFSKVQYGSDTLSTHSTRGQPGAFHTNYETQFSGYNVVIGIKRKTLVFLFKTLLPLLLLVLVVYVTLYFPMSLTKERLMIAISAMLASAVLLTAINTQLVDVGYTTAIEYGFYAFFTLCLFCVIAGLMTERLHTRKNPALADRFDIAARIIYPVITLGVFAYYYYHYF